MTTEIANAGFSLDIDDLIEQSKKETVSSTTIASWLPEGNHEIRVFVDRDKQLFREVRVHNVEKERIPCNKHLTLLGVKDENGNELPKCELCEMSYNADMWKNKPQTIPLYYVHVYATSVTGDNAKYFKPGQTYVIIASSKFKKNLADFLSLTASKNRALLAESMNPTLPGRSFEVSVRRGKDGTVNFSHSLSTEPRPPIPNLNSSWGLLANAWVKDVFDAQKYREAVEKLRDLYHARMLWIVDNPKDIKEDIMLNALTYARQLGKGQIIEHAPLKPEPAKLEPPKLVEQVQAPQAQVTNVQPNLQVRLDAALPNVVPPTANVTAQATVPTAGAPITFVARKTGNPQSACFGNYVQEQVQCAVCDDAIECFEKNFS